jgi:hypothetical protein
MKSTWSLLITLLISFNIVAQSSDIILHKRRNVVFIEAFGPATIFQFPTNLFSINYERFLFSNNKGNGLNIRCGYALHIKYAYMLSGTVFMINYIGGGKTHHFEAGYGVTIVTDHDYPVFHQSAAINSLHEDVISGSFGYRYQKASKPLMFKVCWTPSFRPEMIGSDYFISYFVSLFRMGFAAGYRF